MSSRKHNFTNMSELQKSIQLDKSHPSVNANANDSLASDAQHNQRHTLHEKLHNMGSDSHSVPLRIGTGNPSQHVQTAKGLDPSSKRR